jgi:hypothetical protein
LQQNKYCGRKEQVAADQAKRGSDQKISIFWQRHAFFLQLFQTLQTGRPLISTAHFPPAINPAIMASEETIPIIVEFTYGPNRIPEAPWGNMG